MTFNITFNNCNYNYQLSKPMWESNNMPCMIQSSSDKIIKDEFINKKLENIKLSDEIIKFYKLIGTINQEIYINDWTFFSIQNILKMNENYKKDNIHTIDFAYKYLGMGHVEVAFYNPKLESIYYRQDGGSNGYDRQINYNNLKKINSNNFINDKGYTFDIFLHEITENKL